MSTVERVHCVDTRPRYLEQAVRAAPQRKMAFVGDGHRMELRFLRDTDKREIDFVVLKNRKPLFAVECKSGERDVSPAIRYFAARTNLPHFYQVHLGERHFESGVATVVPLRRFCKDLAMP